MLCFLASISWLDTISLLRKNKPCRTTLSILPCNLGIICVMVASVFQRIHMIKISLQFEKNQNSRRHFKRGKRFTCKDFLFLASSSLVSNQKVPLCPLVMKLQSQKWYFEMNLSVYVRSSGSDFCLSLIMV